MLYIGAPMKSNPMAAGKGGNANQCRGGVAGIISIASPESRVPVRIVQPNPQRDTRFLWAKAPTTPPRLPEPVNQSDIQRGAMQLAHDMEHQSCGRDEGEEIGRAGGETTGAAVCLSGRLAGAEQPQIPIWPAPDTQQIPACLGTAIRKFPNKQDTSRNIISSGVQGETPGVHGTRVVNTAIHSSIFSQKNFAPAAEQQLCRSLAPPWIGVSLSQRHVNPRPQYAGSTDKSRQKLPLDR